MKYGNIANIRARALARWREEPTTSALDVTRELMRTLFGIRVTSAPERLSPKNQREFFAVLAAVASARVDFAAGSAVDEAIEDFRRFAGLP